MHNLNLIYVKLMEIKQAALDEIRTKVAAWPVKDIGWAESDVQTAIKAKEQQSVTVH